MTTATDGIFSPIRIGTMSLGHWYGSVQAGPPPRSAAAAPERGHRPVSRATTGANASMERCATLM
jgi:hypothetical protein